MHGGFLSHGGTPSHHPVVMDDTLDHDLALKRMVPRFPTLW